MNEPHRGPSTLTVLGVSLASALVPLNSTMIAVALPTIAEAFDIRVGRAGVLVTVYLAAMLLIQPIAGVMCDVVGARRLAFIAIIGFVAFSGAAMLSRTFDVLVIFRGAQATFAAALAPSVQAMLRMMTEPRERGRAFGTLGSVIGVGAGLGPVLGGALVGLFGWRAIFAVNLPIGVVVFFVLARTGHAESGESPQPRQERPRASTQRLVNRSYVFALATQSFTVLTQYALLLVTPILLHDRGWNSGSIGLGLSLLTVGLIVMGPVGGRLSDQRGRRAPVVIGIALAAIPVVITASFGDDPATLLLLVTLTIFGIGTGLATPSIGTVAMESAPEGRFGVAAGLLSSSRYIGSIISSVALTVLVDDDGTGVGVVMIIAAASITVAASTARRLPTLRPHFAVEPVVR